MFHHLCLLSGEAVGSEADEEAEQTGRPARLPDVRSERARRRPPGAHARGERHRHDRRRGRGAGLEQRARRRLPAH